MFARNVTYVKCATFFRDLSQQSARHRFFLRRHLSRCVPPCPEGSGGPAGSHPAESLVGCLLLEELSLLAGCKLLYLWAAFILLFWQTADCDAALSLHFDGAIAKPGPSQAATHGAATLATSIILSPRCVRLEVVTLPCTYNPNPSSQRRNQFLMR